MEEPLVPLYRDQLLPLSRTLNQAVNIDVKETVEQTLQIFV